MDDRQVTTLTGTAVAIVALARALASIAPNLEASLKEGLAHAIAAGLDPKDLDLLRTMIRAISLHV